jgi:uncharacterized damage-inducible protein DinB
MPSALEVEDALRDSRERLLDAIRGVTEEQFKRRPAEGWSIAEVLAHLLATEKTRAEQLSAALAGGGVGSLSINNERRLEDAAAGRRAPVPQLVHGLLAARRETERLLQKAAESSALEQNLLGRGRGDLTVGDLLLRRVAGHEAGHVRQIEALKRGFGA